MDSLFKHYPFSIIVLNKEHELIYANSKCYKMFCESKRHDELEKIIGNGNCEKIASQTNQSPFIENIYTGESVEFRSWQFTHLSEKYVACSLKRNLPDRINGGVQADFQHSKNPKLIIDTNYIILERNRRWAELFEHDSSINMDLFSQINVESYLQIKLMLDEMLEKEGTHRSLRVALIAKDEKVYHFVLKIHFIKDKEIHLFSLSFSDVTNKIKLNSFKNILKKSLDSADSPVCVFKHDGAVLFYNKAFKSVNTGQTFYKSTDAWEIMEVVFGIHKHDVQNEISKKKYYSYELPKLSHLKSYFSYTVYIKRLFFGDYYYILSLKKKLYGVKNSNVTFKIHKTVYDVIDDVVFVLDSFFLIKTINAKGIKYFEINRSEITSTSFVNLAAIQDKNLLVENFVHVLEGHSISFEVRMSDKKEGYRWFSLKCAPIYENGEISEIVGIARDINRTKEVTNKLKLHTENLESMVRLRTYEMTRSRKQYQTLINGASDIIYMVNRDFKITMINDAGCLFIGLPLKVIRGKHISEVFPKSISETLKDAMFGSFYSKKAFSGEHDVVFEGNVISLHTNLSLVKDKDENIVEFVGISRDITLMKKLQKKVDTQRQTVIQAGKLASIGEMATGIAHELGQPLNHLKLTISMNEMELEKENPDMIRVRDLYHSCLHEIDRASEIVSHLKGFGRKESNEENVGINCHTILEECHVIFDNVIKRNNVEFITELNAEFPVFFGGKNRFEQVLINLFQNAKDAMEESEIKQLTYRTYNEDKFIIIEIIDTGHGISDEAMEKLFTPFYTTKEVGKGTGIGLSISYGIISEFNGSISVTNNSDSGCTFTIKLPTFKGELI